MFTYIIFNIYYGFLQIYFDKLNLLLIEEISDNIMVKYVDC